MLARTEDELLKGLNAPQRQAVLHEEGPLLVLAGAGSGKTRVLTHRVARLLLKGVEPYNILAVTFTNKAAGEMRERLQQLTGRTEQQLPIVSTFHSFCVKFLRSEITALGFDTSFTIYDSADQKSLVKSVMKERHLPTEQIKPNSIQSIISRWKNEQITPLQAVDHAQSYTEEVAAEVYEGYQSGLKQANALDFDDLLLNTVKLLEQEPTVLRKYQERFHYILVDEYQDTNTVQYNLISLLAAQHQNLCVVGDDWQSIYGWRGADIQNILNFERDYPSATVIKLEQNYRSTQHILDAADFIIKQNTTQKEKTLFTESGNGDKVKVVEARDAFDEARVIAIDAQQLIQEQVDLNDVAVLYRTNAQSRILERVLLERNIPYKIVGGVRFYDRKEVKDVLGYLRLLRNQFDSASLDRVINEPKRGIGEKTQSVLTQYAASKGIGYIDAGIQLQQDESIPNGTRAKLSGFAQSMDLLKKKTAELPVSELIRYVAQETGLRDVLKDGTDEGEARWENILELSGAAKKFDDERETGLDAFLEEVALISDLDKTENKDEPSITLMTMHNAKGLEFHTVYVVGCEEGIFPHARTLEDQKELEEENRLCYVAMTRAKRRLFLIHCFERELFGNVSMNEPSRFVTELPQHAHEKVTSRELWSQPGGGRSGKIFEQFRKPSRYSFGRDSALDEAYQESYEETAPVLQVEESYDEPVIRAESSIDQGVVMSDGGESSSESDEISQYRSGQAVQHPIFGKGIVVSVRDGSLLIAFSGVGLKTLDPAHTQIVAT